MKFPIFLQVFIFSLILLSCNSKKNKNKEVIEVSTTSEATETPKNNNRVGNEIYFKASGNEPFWGLEVSGNTIKLRTIGDSIVAPHTIPAPAMDANLKMYKVQTESNEMTIQITKSECTDSMSGMISPYTVTVTYKKNTEEALTKLQGCGRYITDYRLNANWVLEKINGNTITKENLSKEVPTLKINSTANTFSGFAGCNPINGSLFFEKGLLRFTEISTTEMLCEPANDESKFLKALQSSTNYKIENNRLILSNPDRNLLTFKKAD